MFNQNLNDQYRKFIIPDKLVFMKNFFFSVTPAWPEEALGIVRILVGLFMIYHGCEIFDDAKMNDYATWEVFKKFSSPGFIVYGGKIAELTAGILISIGFLTRIACIILASTMIYISFFVGKGIIWYGDQHPFLFVLLAMIFLFVGPGRWSADKSVFSINKTK